MIVKSNHYRTATEMKAILEEKYQDLEVSERTVRRELSNLSYVATLPRKVPLLTEQAKINRLSWAQDHVHYNWKKVDFQTKQLSSYFAIRC